MPSDGVLLRRFVQDADEQAFSIIVERHASLVMSVCRRIVGQQADCDDAFQATFYALSQRPDSIRECRSLTGWLYSVAWRTSVRFVRLRKRTKMETLPDQLPDAEQNPLDRIAAANDLATLDEELNQLPENYRHVLVMSYFAHQTNQEIADQLNESKGVVDGRIREARRLLRVRLARRGVEIGSLLVAGSLAQSASAAVSPQLISTTVQFAKLSCGFNSTVSVTGVDLNQMQILSSTGTTVMGIKAGTFLATGFLMLTGAFGLSQLLARQDAAEPGESGPAVAATTADQEALTASEPLSAEVAASAEDSAPDTASEASDTDAGASGSGFGSAGPGSGGLGGSGGTAASSGLSGISGGTIFSAPPSSGDQPPRSEMTGGSGTGMSAGGSPRKSGARAEFSRAGARKVQEDLHSAMNSLRVPELKFPGQNSLRDILDSIEGYMASYSILSSPRFVLDESDDNIGVDASYLDTTQIDDVSIAEDSMTLASALDLILRKVKDQDPRLTWIVENEVILITTVDSAESSERAFIRSYDVKKLRPMFEEMATAVPMVPDFSGNGGGGSGGGFFMVPQASPAAMSGVATGSTPPVSDPARGGMRPDAVGGGMAGGDSSTPAESVMIQNTWQRCLINEIQSLTTPPCQWQVNGDDFGTMSVVGDRLIVQQTRSGHEKVVEVLEELELAIETP